MGAFDPTLLSPVTRVEVRVLRRGGPTVGVTGEAAERIAGLWRRLPPGRQARCHLPVYELRFLAGGDEVCRGSVCWKCNNIHGVVDGTPFAYEFDAQAPTSQSLLTEVRTVTGECRPSTPGESPDRSESSVVAPVS